MYLDTLEQILGNQLIGWSMIEILIIDQHKIVINGLIIIVLEVVINIEIVILLNVNVMVITDHLIMKSNTFLTVIFYE